MPENYFELMTVEETLDFFRLSSRRTLDNWLYTGVLPRDTVTRKIGHKLYFLRTPLSKFLNLTA